MIKSEHSSNSFIWKRVTANIVAAVAAMQNTYNFTAASMYKYNSYYNERCVWMCIWEVLSSVWAKGLEFPIIFA